MSEQRKFFKSVKEAFGSPDEEEDLKKKAKREALKKVSQPLQPALTSFFENRLKGK